EITNLFISFLRSLKIPVKYISGLAYNGENSMWSPHAWAEVYFPGYGWLPFDVTFGQYGWIDPSHIKMMEGFDANEPSVEYNWRAIKVGIDSKKFEATAELKEKGEKFDPLLSLELKLLKNNVGEGSYVPIEITVKNLQPFYISSLVYVNVAPDLVGDNTKAILLKPLQEKKLYWLVNVTEDLSSGIMYTGEIVVKDSFGSRAAKELNFAKGLDIISIEEANDVMNELEVEEAQVREYDLNFDCDSEKKVYYRYEKLNVICSLENKGNVPIDVNLCLKRDCKDVKLSINQDKKVSFVFDLKDYTEMLFVRAISGNHVESDYLTFEVYDESELEVKNIYYDSVRYGQKGEIKIDVNVVPSVDKLIVEIDKVGSFSYDNVVGFKTLKIPFKSWDFNEGNNFVNIKFIYYHQDKGQDIEKGFALEIKKVSFLEKILVNFKKLIF
ncbi:MAG: transglutaminase-like domain-containing protein, partial [Nanoarchaeota archaeon]|nr:transglutaminase-like domain-containing protein [Nanoarchaeota archaeon]